MSKVYFPLQQEATSLARERVVVYMDASKRATESGVGRERPYPLRRQSDAAAAAAEYYIEWVPDLPSNMREEAEERR